MEKLNVCMVGAGVISNFHMEAYKQNKHVHIYGIYDINENRAAEKAKKFTITRVFASFDDVLADEQVDVVHICTRNDTHADLSIRALQASKHVFVEKPMAITLEEALQVQEVAKKVDRTFQVGLVRRFASNTVMAYDMIADGMLGDIYYAKATHLRKAGNPGGWFAQKELSGGGPLIDLGIHLIDVCWCLMGRPNVQSVSSNMYEKLGNRQHVKSKMSYQSADAHAHENNIEDMVNGIVRFENDASLVLDVSYSLHAKEDQLQIELFGTKGGLVLEPELAFVTENQDTILNSHPQMDHLSFQMEQAFIGQMNAFVEKCLLQGKSDVPVEDGVAVMKIIDAIYESAKERKAVYFQKEKDKASNQ